MRCQTTSLLTDQQPAELEGALPKSCTSFMATVVEPIPTGGTRFTEAMAQLTAESWSWALALRNAVTRAPHVCVHPRVLRESSTTDSAIYLRSLHRQSERIKAAAALHLDPSEFTPKPLLSGELSEYELPVMK
eukprot:4530096-Amphidinium_carterae.2